MKALIDTNIILDVLCDRREFVKDSEKVFKLCEVKKIDGYISALSVPNIVYIMRKELDFKKIKNVIESLSLIFTITDLKADDINKAALMDFGDYEDAIQSACAERMQMDCIVTRNVKDFANSRIPAVTPAEFTGKSDF